MDIVSLPFVEWPGSVLRENLFTFLKAALLFYFAIFLVDTPRRLRQFVAFFVGCQVLRVLEPLYMNLTTGYLGGRTWLGPGEWAGRLSGAPTDVVNSNGLGFVIATAVVFTYFLLWQSPRKLLKITYVFLLPAMLYALILTMSRGAFIALAVGAWLVLWQSKHKPMLITVGLALCVGGWMIMSDVQRERYMSIFSSEETPQSQTAQGRIDGMKEEFRLGMNRPIVGHGVGTTPEAKVNVAGARAKASHNLYAELLIEVGIIGAILFVSFMWQILRVTQRNRLILASRVTNEESEYDFPARLNRALFVIFWVYAVYSINYYGLSQDYWYIFGGICVAFGFIMQRTEGAELDNRESTPQTWRTPK
jgi:putative inorganic carbon (hco3(-)) transporter